MGTFRGGLDEVFQLERGLDVALGMPQPLTNLEAALGMSPPLANWEAVLGATQPLASLYTPATAVETAAAVDTIATVVGKMDTSSLAADICSASNPAAGLV